MLVTQGSARSASMDRTLACALAAIAGAVNCAAFQAVGFFSANMTGNVSIMSSRIAFSAFSPALFYLVIVLTFVFGAGLSTLFINEGLRRDVRAIYASSILIEGVLMGALGGMATFLSVERAVSMVVLGASFLMGWQNAVVTNISGARVRTTHVSGMVTDIGIELANSVDMALGRRTTEDRPANYAKLKLHCWAVGSFIVGGIVGVMTYQAVHGLLFVLSACLLVMLAVSGLLKARLAA